MHRKKGLKNLFHSCGSFRVAHNSLIDETKSVIMKIRYKYGFYINGSLYGWKQGDLYRLPKTTIKGHYPLRKMKIMKVGNKKGYVFNGIKKSIQQLKAITTEINYIYHEIKHEDLPI